MECVRFDHPPALRRPVLVLAFTGWNDAGEAASTAVRYLAGQLNAIKFASIDPDPFYDFTVQRPQVKLAEGTRREIVWISTEFFAARLPGAERDIAFGVGPEPHLRWRTFADAILEFGRTCGVEMLVTLGGFLAEVLYSRPVQISGFAADPALAKRLGLSPSRYEGPTGIVGVLADACHRAGVPSVSLWAALPHYIAASPNPRGALALLIQLSALLGLHPALTEIEQAAAEFEANVNEAVAQDPKLAAYVRELKKREFVH